MNILTVSFFGHREVERPMEIEDRLDKLLHDLINQKEYVEFLIGRDGEFDLLAASVIRRAIRNYSCGKGVSKQGYYKKSTKPRGNSRLGLRSLNSKTAI